MSPFCKQENSCCCLSRECTEDHQIKGTVYGENRVLWSSQVHGSKGVFRLRVHISRLEDTQAFKDDTIWMQKYRLAKEPISETLTFIVALIRPTCFTQLVSLTFSFFLAVIHRRLEHPLPLLCSLFHRLSSLMNRWRHDLAGNPLWTQTTAATPKVPQGKRTPQSTDFD